MLQNGWHFYYGIHVTLVVLGMALLVCCSFSWATAVAQINVLCKSVEPPSFLYIFRWK